MSDHEQFPHWQRCPEDAIAQMVRGNVDKRRRKILATMGMGSVVAVTGITVFGTFVAGSGNKRSLAITCLEVQRLYPKFLTSQLVSFDKERIRYHLRSCRHCFVRYSRPSCKPPGSCGRSV